MKADQIQAIVEAITASERAQKAFRENQAEREACRIFIRQMREFLKTIATEPL